MRVTLHTPSLLFSEDKHKNIAVLKGPLQLLVKGMTKVSTKVQYRYLITSIESLSEEL